MQLVENNSRTLGTEDRCSLHPTKVPDLQDKHDLEPLGPADGPVKNAIFGINAAGQYGIELDSDGHPIENYKDDELSRLKAEYSDAGNQRDNLFWGWIQNRKSG